MKHYVLVQNNEIIQHYTAETKPAIAATKGTVYEYKETPQPEFDALTEKCTLSHRVYYGKFEQVWTVEPLTAADDWHYPDWSKRITAPAALVMEDIGVKMLGWWQIMGYPIERHGSNVRLYCNVILPEHQAIVDGLAGVITIENKS